MENYPRTTVTTRLGPISVRQDGSDKSASRNCLFLLHGIGGNADAWRQQYSAFGKHFRVIGWDAPGYGDSFNFSEQAPGVEDYAAAFIALMDALEVEKATVIGHSLGG